MNRDWTSKGSIDPHHYSHSLQKDSAGKNIMIILSNYIERHRNRSPTSTKQECRSLNLVCSVRFKGLTQNVAMFSTMLSTFMYFVKFILWPSIIMSFFRLQ